MTTPRDLSFFPFPSCPAAAPAASVDPDPDAIDWVLRTGQCADLSLPAGTLLVLAEGRLRLQAPASGLLPAGWRPPAHVLGEGEAFVCEQSGRWRLQVLRSGRLQVHRPLPFVTHCVRRLKRVLSHGHTAPGTHGQG